MLTVGQLNAQISLLRSKIAVTEGLILYLKTHYMPSEAGDADPEMSFHREDDYGRVPPGHINSSIEDYVDYLDGLRAKLSELEGTGVIPEAIKPVEPPVLEEGKTTEAEEPPPAPTPAPITKIPRKESTRAATSGSSDQPAPKSATPVSRAG
jgi:hypothetical protein